MAVMDEHTALTPPKPEPAEQTDAEYAREQAASYWAPEGWGPQLNVVASVPDRTQKLILDALARGRRLGAIEALEKMARERCLGCLTESRLEFNENLKEFVHPDKGHRWHCDAQFEQRELARLRREP